MPTEEEEAMLRVDLYLTRQSQPEPGEDDRNALHCMFCGKGHGVEWETSYNNSTHGSCRNGVCEQCRTHLKPKGKPEATEGFVHVDDFIDDFRADPYARFVLDYFRKPAVNLQDFKPFMEGRKLFCTYKAARWRVTGASRLGDVWLAFDHGREIGYDQRVNVAECSEWGDHS